MSTRIRFTTAQQVFETFPKVTAKIGLPAGDEPPVEFLRKLVAREQGFEPIIFTACMLPRREAVWWGCQCIRALTNNKVDEPLRAAEAWVRDSEDAMRRAALAIGLAGDTDIETTWMALAAGYAGGSLAPENAPPVPSPPDATAVYLKAGLIVAVVSKPMAEQRAWINAFVEAGLRFAEGGDAKVSPPSR